MIKEKKMKKKIVAGLVCAVMAASCALAACGETENMAKLGWSTGERADGAYDTTLFYRNDNTFSSPDPGMIYISEGEEAGWYYFYPTSIDGLSVRAYRTKDFINYEMISGAAFTFETGGWAVEQLWAPEVFYYKPDGAEKGMYIMYYSASSFITGDAEEANKWNGMNLGIAVSDSPKGPFTDYVGEQQYQPYDAQGRRIDPESGEPLGDDDPQIWLTRTVQKGTPPLFYAGEDPSTSFEIGPVAYDYLADKTEKNVFATIDAHPFVDDDGQMYLYFVKHQDRNTRTNSVWGVKMRDPFSPDYDSLTPIAIPNRKTPSDTQSFGPENVLDYTTTINEGPAVVKHTTQKPDGSSTTKYYLAYSNYGFSEKMYSVYVAVADNPLGPFVKLETGLGQPLISVEPQYDYLSGTGHNIFFETPDGELYTAYHAWCTPTSSDTRGVMVDRVSWIYREDLGYDVMHVNGPTKSLQPLPMSVSGYKNIAQDAAITVTNTQSDPSLLTDGAVAIHASAAALEVRTQSETTITLEFEGDRAVRGIMLYNSYDLEYAFSKLDRVVVEDSAGNKYYAENVPFSERNVSVDRDGNPTQIHTGSAATIIFREQNIKKITITVSAKYKTDSAAGNSLGFSEICVLGK